MPDIPDEQLRGYPVGFQVAPAGKLSTVRVVLAHPAAPYRLTLRDPAFMVEGLSYAGVRSLHPMLELEPESTVAWKWVRRAPLPGGSVVELVLRRRGGAPVPLLGVWWFLARVVGEPPQSIADSVDAS